MLKTFRKHQKAVVLGVLWALGMMVLALIACAVQAFVP